MTRAAVRFLATGHGRLLVQFISFGLVGVAGFVVDAGTLWLARKAGLDLYSGRVVSFLVAATATWLLNRTFTFRGPHRVSLFSQWSRFLVANAPGGLVNYAVYSLLVTFVALCTQHPTLAVGAGSIAGLLFNFTASKLFVFR